MAEAADKRVVNALIMIVMAITRTLGEEQRAEAHEFCDGCIDDPSLMRALGFSDVEGTEAARGIIDRVFTGVSPRLDSPPLDPPGGGRSGD